MNKATAVLSIGYIFSAYTLGMLLHPYKTVRELVRRPTFKIMVLVPSIFWFMGWFIGMVGLRFGWVLLWVVGVNTTPIWLIESLAFTFWWGTVFLVLWQFVVGYLWVRLKSALVK